MAVLRRASAAEPSARFGSMAELLACWTAAVAEPAEAAGVPGLGTPVQGAAGVAVDARPVVANPYKGLRAFDEGDANDFFGRDSSVDGLLAIVHAQPLTLVVGPSGSGKSSLVRAGLVPRLRAEGWLVTTAVPGAAPLDELADALVRVAVRPHHRTFASASSTQSVWLRPSRPWWRTMGPISSSSSTSWRSSGRWLTRR